MKDFIVYDGQGEILQVGHCQNRDFYIQAKDGEFVMEGTADGVTQKIEFDGLDEKGQPINPRVVDKTLEEIEAEKPPELPEPPEMPLGQRVAHVTNEQWQDVLKRLKKLEKS